VGLALLLGADLGSALAARILLAPISAVIPVLFLIGVPLYLSARTPKLRQLGRILIGLGLVLLALGLIREATIPMRQSEIVGDIVVYLGRDLYAAFLIGATLAWAAHSSVAAVLMAVTFAAQGLLPAQGGAALVLGANLGGALIAFTLTLSSKPDVRRIVIANLLIRGLGAAIALFALNLAPGFLAKLGATAGAQVIHLHLAFNLCVVVVGLPLLGALLKISSAFVLGDQSGDMRRTSALDVNALSNPDQALACVKREILRMGEDVVEMTVRVIDLFPKWQSEQQAFIKAAQKDVEELHLEIKLYIAQMQKAKMTGEQSRRAMELTKVAGHFAEAGDLVTSNLVDLARRMSMEGLAFSDAGQREISDFHDRIVANLHLALNVLVSTDADSARQLVEEKDMVRSEEKRLQKRHIKRLRKGNSASIETTNLHQEALRTLKQINASFAYVAYPIVEDTGDLLSSRLSVRDGGPI
jgi:phosphate:Na+ symporter